MLCFDGIKWKFYVKWNSSSSDLWNKKLSLRTIYPTPFWGEILYVLQLQYFAIFVNPYPYKAMYYLIIEKHE